MKKPNKYNYVFVIQGLYPDSGWEDLIEWETIKEATASLWDYRENEKECPHRMIRRRELATVAEPNSSSITSVL